MPKLPPPQGPKRRANCSFCRKSYRVVGPLVEGPKNVFICEKCIGQSADMLRSAGSLSETDPLDDFPTPSQLKRKLDEYIIGQDDVKAVLSVLV
ncbi:MAG: ATP-dependent Clp protease ATP-binding subunit ClpX, partial [Planctomycetaceae bacterium]|nr:ATP-dependent Clp protease ATP-binding subunit ClpX [Planctomycetaceae bacterium]